MTRPEDLITKWLDDSLTASERKPLQTWLEASDEHIRQLVDCALLEQQIRTAVIGLEQQTATQILSGNGPVGQETNRSTNIDPVIASAGHSTAGPPAHLNHTTSDDAGLHTDDFPSAPQHDPQHDPPQPPGGRKNVRGRFRSTLVSFCLAAACLLAIYLSVFTDSHKRPRGSKSINTFATLTRTKAALWASGSLPTADGSRLTAGTLHLIEGIASLSFDSGARVTMEAPAQLTLEDAMNCRLSVGTVVSDIPDAATGFRILTPSANIVDYGTRFAVSVLESTGETHTQVMEGLVQVENLSSRQIVELRTGQQNTTASDQPVMVTDDIEVRTLPVPPHGQRRQRLLTTISDLYTGRAAGHESTDLIYVKSGFPERIGYLKFDLTEVPPEEIDSARLTLHFAPTGWGLASLVPDATFQVFGLAGVPAWDERLLYGSFPAVAQQRLVGSFTVPQGVQKGEFAVATTHLTEFLRGHAGQQITIRIVRVTPERERGGLVHGFASRRHPVLPPPTLAIESGD